MGHTETTIRTVRWADVEDEIRKIRDTVFIQEQNVPEDLEWDGLDPECAHVLVYNETGEPVGTGRLSEGGHIGRMAVLKDWRGKGIGDLILQALVELSRKQGLSRVTLWAQTHAVPFYERHGFLAVGQEFLDAGIPHREMYLVL